MTEAEWLAGTDAWAMYGFVHARTSERRQRLLAVACAWDDLARARTMGELLNFGDPGNEALYWDAEYGYETAIRRAEIVADGGSAKSSGSWFVSGRMPAVAALGEDPENLISVPPERVEATIRSYTTHPAVYIREVFGNPFRPVAFSPDWRTGTTVAIARGMYESRDFSAMPILADALQDTGCDSAEVLDHCRGPGPHVRGCWVVDLVLGKE